MHHFIPIRRIRFGGFTLVELMVTLSVAVILISIGVPSFQQTIANNRAASGANELLGALQLARSEAVRLNSNVTLCASTNGTTCTGGGEWARGWIVLHDDEILRVGAAMSSGVTILGPAGSLTYTNAGVATAAEFDLAVSGGSNPERCIEVIVSGVSRVLQSACPE
jgi:type IV fimbrial biogenesis protein FimT